jgi:hypothetical protein
MHIAVCDQLRSYVISAIFLQLDLFTYIKDFLITDLQDYPNPTVLPQNVKLYLLYAHTWGRGRGGRNNLFKMQLNPFLYIQYMEEAEFFWIFF